MTHEFEAFYLPTGNDGVFEPTPATASPWDHSLQHGGPPAALLARAIESVRSDPALSIARFTADMLGGIPQGTMRVEAHVVRPGRRVELVEASLWAGDQLAVKASAWLIRATPGSTREHWRPTEKIPAIPPASSERFFEGVSPDWGYGRALDWRFVSGGYEPGPATVWARLRVPLVAGEQTSPVQRLLVLADSTNGLSGSLPMSSWYFIPPTVTVTVERPPVSEWMLLDAHSTIGPDGIGLAQGDMADEHGRFAVVTQPLMVAPR
ncbi:thioesterase family protein [Nocardioides sp. NPDC057577]|uniref:thioesterase family protein n=1 Tax=Nocardioides sp. NPDC057577 TaxID=3346171 RepID=UPI003670B07A